MYVCLCNGVTERAVREAVDEGVRTFRELSFKTGCGTQCGSCIPVARALLREQIAEADPHGAPPLQVAGAA